jgi:hypothetical protein
MSLCHDGGLLKINASEEAPSMSKIATGLSSVTSVGLNIAKHVFQVHAVDAAFMTRIEALTGRRVTPRKRGPKPQTADV